MRWVYLIVIVVFVAAIVLFAIQNRELVTMSFLGLQRPCAARGYGRHRLRVRNHNGRQPVRVAA